MSRFSRAELIDAYCRMTRRHRNSGLFRSLAPMDIGVNTFKSKAWDPLYPLIPGSRRAFVNRVFLRAMKKHTKLAAEKRRKALEALETLEVNLKPWS